MSKRALVALAAVAIAASAWLAVRESTDNRPRFRPRSPERIAARALADSVSRLGLLVQAEEVRGRVDSAILGIAPGRPPRVIVVGSGSAALLARMTDSLLGGLGADEGAIIPMRLALVQA
ncbi:MAG TPA: hypothetical protein PK948_11115, partial [Gemmatimonadales bacterium]|nr:hypothetical protein [Gemmatimonadales bacterium]